MAWCCGVIVMCGYDEWDEKSARGQPSAKTTLGGVRRLNRLSFVKALRNQPSRNYFANLALFKKMREIISSHFEEPQVRDVILRRLASWRPLAVLRRERRFNRFNRLTPPSVVFADGWLLRVLPREAGLTVSHPQASFLRTVETVERRTG